MDARYKMQDARCRIQDEEGHCLIGLRFEKVLGFS
jgi:hypothetical protein